MKAAALALVLCALIPAARAADANPDDDWVACETWVATVVQSDSRNAVLAFDDIGVQRKMTEREIALLGLPPTGTRLCRPIVAID
ncbi:hypothetical protein [Noviherbaspirillum humi]|nr:hypothetical protein [Noviherbaspirillum humi]